MTLHTNTQSAMTLSHSNPASVQGSDSLSWHTLARDMTLAHLQSHANTGLTNPVFAQQQQTFGPINITGTDVSKETADMVLLKPRLRSLFGVQASALSNEPNADA